MMSCRMKKVLSGLFAVCFLLPLTLFSAAGEYSGETSGTHICVYNSEYSTFVYEKSADEKIAPGPSAKIMTAVLALEYFAGDLERRVTVSSSALNNIYGSTVIGLKQGETVRAIDLIYAVLVGGASDAAGTLACAIAGSTASFAVKMTEKAHALGATSTVYQNPTGLDARGAVTTPRDTAIIAAYAVTVPRFAEICNTSAYKIPATDMSDAKTVYTRNMLISGDPSNIYRYSESSGICVGYTDEAGYCAVSMIYGNYTYICVAMGAADAGGAYTDVKNLLSFSKNNYEAKKILDKSQIITEIPVELSADRSYVTVIPEKNLYAFLPKDTDISAVKYETVITDEKLTAPVLRGDGVGEIILSLDGREIGRCALTAKFSVPRSGWLSFWAAVKNNLGILVVGVIIAAAVCAAFVFVKIHSFDKKAGLKK